MRQVAIPPEEKELRNYQKGSIVWLTGLSGAGKTTLGNQIERILFDQGRLVFFLDGDKVRNGLNADLGFSREDRTENIRRISEVSKLLAESGMIVIVAVISPFRKDRDNIRRTMEPGRFIEVFVDSPIEVCEERDIKGLYKKARGGLIKDFTGISSPYERPLSPEIHLRTNKETVDDSINKILDCLNETIIHC